MGHIGGDEWLRCVNCWNSVIIQNCYYSSMTCIIIFDTDPSMIIWSLVLSMRRISLVQPLDLWWCLHEWCHWNNHLTFGSCLHLIMFSAVVWTIRSWEPNQRLRFRHFVPRSRLHHRTSLGRLATLIFTLTFSISPYASQSTFHVIFLHLFLQEYTLTNTIFIVIPKQGNMTLASPALPG